MGVSGVCLDGLCLGFLQVRAIPATVNAKRPIIVLSGEIPINNWTETTPATRDP